MRYQFSRIESDSLQATFADRSLHVYLLPNQSVIKAYDIDGPLYKHLPLKSTTMLYKDVRDVTIESETQPGHKPNEKPEVEPDNLPQEDPGIHPEEEPEKEDDDDDDEPYSEPGAADDPDEIKKKTTIM